MAGVGDLAGGVSQTNFYHARDFSQAMEKLGENIHFTAFQRPLGADLKAGKNAVSLVKSGFAQLLQRMLAVFLKQSGTAHRADGRGNAENHRENQSQKTSDPDLNTVQLTPHGKSPLILS